MTFPKRLLLSAAALLPALGALAGTPDSTLLHRISDEVLLRGQCYNNLRVLCKTVGHRLSGSPAAANAVQWGKAALEAAGADSVWLQPVMVPVWVRGAESLKIDTGGGLKAVSMLSLGNSEGTKGKLLTGTVVLVNNFEELAKLTDAEVRGKILFFNYRWRQDMINTMQAYGDAGPYRWRAPNLAAARGAAGVIIRSLSSGEDDAPHTGSMRYADTVQKIPAVAVGNRTADALERACRRNKGVKMQLVSNCTLKGEAMSYNVIGQINGSENRDEIVIAGGHLDSWDVGEGAHDDGAGCVQSIEMIRTLKALGLKPKRTVRAVLFMNEENGVRGGNAYADSAIANGQKHIFALETDEGGFAPRGFGFEFPKESTGAEAQRARLMQLAGCMQFMNLHSFDRKGSGTDIEPLQKSGTVLCGLLPDPQRYFDLHHTRQDVFEAVNHRELKLGAAAIAGMIWMVSENGL